MKNLPTIYARVIATKPELAVSGTTLDWCDPNDPEMYQREYAGNFADGYWFLSDDGFEAEIDADSPIAEALILKRWLEALPKGSRLCKSDDDETWSVVWVIRWPENDNEGLIADSTKWVDSGLLALAEFHVPGSTELSK